MIMTPKTQKDKKSRNKATRALIIMACSLFLGLVCAFFISKERGALMTNGVETVGMVTRTYVAGSRYTDCLIINYSFIKDDTILDGITSFYLNEREQFDRAVVGGTYRVRYNPNKPNKKSRIYIDEPIPVSDEKFNRLSERLVLERGRVEKSKTWWKNF